MWLRMDKECNTRSSRGSSTLSVIDWNARQRSRGSEWCFRTGSLRTRLLELQIDRAVVRWRRLEERNFTAMMEKVDRNYQSDGL